MRLLLLVLIALIPLFNCKLFIEIKEFSRIVDTQYFIQSSAEVPKKNIENSTDVKENCNPKLYDKVGEICYAKCSANFKRYYNNLCISESKSCPSQFTKQGSNCVLNQCPNQMKLSQDENNCENSCPKFFKRGMDLTCESDYSICPMEYKKEKNFCIIQRCRNGLLINGICLDTACPPGYNFLNNHCSKCDMSTQTVCSDMEYKCPKNLIEIGSGKHLKCVMICPKNYAQYGNHCYDISVPGCPEGFLLLNNQSCIEASKCPSNNEGNECHTKSNDIEFILDSGKVTNDKMLEDCPQDFVMYKGDCLKLNIIPCPDKMFRIENSPFCVSTCPKGFKEIAKACLAEMQCVRNEFTFMNKCYTKCPPGTRESEETKSCKVAPNCAREQVLDLSKLKCINREMCNESSFRSPKGNLCHRKDQCGIEEYILDQYCVLSCPLEYEVSTPFCKKKSSRCSKLRLLNGTCVEKCPEGYLSKNKICVHTELGQKKVLCGINKKMKICSTSNVKCVEECVCKEGFSEVNGEEYCIPMGKNCPSTHILDLVFLIDGTSDIDETSFNEIKYSMFEAATQVYTSKIDVRVGVVVYGSNKPHIILLYQTPKLCDCVRLISKIVYVNNAEGTTLIDAFRIANEVVLLQSNGARIGSVRQIIVISKFEEFSTNKKADLIQKINLNKNKGHSLTFVTIGKIEDISNEISILESQSTKEIFRHMNKLFAIVCKDISCPNGYEKIDDKCIDINECDSQPCHENSICLNTPGSFTCYCKEDKTYQSPEIGCGYIIDECELKIKKTVCDAMTCQSPAKCSIYNGFDFCICPRGFIYKEQQGCIDVDECLVNPCLGNGSCTNTNASFDCSCIKGYTYNLNFGCIDINECEDSSKCSGNGICQNLLGSYKCTCNSGYEYIVNQGCIDIDECKQTKNLCKGENVLCQNTPGSFKCACPVGYDYKVDGCVDIDECKTSNNCPEGSLCKNNVGGFTCSCANGFVFMKSTNTCELDETLNVIKPKADLIFGVDVSMSMKEYMTEVKDMVKNIIVDYKLKSLAVVKRYFAVTTGGDNDVKIIYSKETDINVLNHTDDIAYLGGKSLLSKGLESCRNLYIENGQVNSSKLVIFITSTKPTSYNAEELLSITKEKDKILKKARLLIIYIGENLQSKEWNVIFNENEIEEHVIVVSHSFISTIHKVIYERTDRLIKCPDGFVFLDKVCQYKTLHAKYCKWDNKLYAFNSSWTSSCATYKCEEKGVTVLETKCLGFDGQCYKENDFFPCNQDGKLNWRCKCKIVQYMEEETKKNQQRIDYTIIAFDQNATITNTKLDDLKGKCVLPFKYEDVWYYACTDSRSTQRWCSHDMYYKAQYSYCSRQVTSQCIFEGKVYKEGEKWSLQCNDIQCNSGQPSITVRCKTTIGTCVPKNTENYPCEYNDKKYTSCMCTEDSNGYGENAPISKEITGEKKVNNEFGLVQYCEHLGTGMKYEIGKSWVIDCFKMECQEHGITKIIEKSCSSSDGKCYNPGKMESFTCDINGQRKLNCQCVKENDELVIVSKEGGKTEKEVIQEKTNIFSMLNNLRGKI